MKYGPLEQFPPRDSNIKRWVVDHEDLEEELGIVTPQEDLPHHLHEEDEEEETELLYHFR